jgi:hypothetical protein
MQCSTHYSNPPIAPAVANRCGGGKGSDLLDAHGNVRTLASFPSYELLEKSSPDSFEPSLKEIQEMVASVVIMKLKKPENSEKKECDVCRIRPLEDHIVVEPSGDPACFSAFSRMPGRLYLSQEPDRNSSL